MSNSVTDTEATENEIEVTPEMIEAGKECIASVWLDFTGPSGHLEWGPVLTRVFRAMSAARVDEYVPPRPDPSVPFRW